MGQERNAKFKSKHVDSVKVDLGQPLDVYGFQVNIRAKIEDD